MPDFKMISRNLSFLWCLFCFFLLCFDTKMGNSVLLGCFCGSDKYDATGSTGSTYRTNLNFLLSTLSNASRTTTNGFYNFTAGGSSSDKIYGLFLCQGDLSSDVCEVCVATASSEILQGCPDQKFALVIYDICSLRYSNQSIFSMDVPIVLSPRAAQNVTQPDLFNQALGDTLDKIAITAANSLSGKKFAVQEANFVTFQQRLYALGQCTPDLSSEDCELCLRKAIFYLPTCCKNNLENRVFFPSCYIRYAPYRFYGINVDPLSEPKPNLPAPPPSFVICKEDGRASTRLVVAILVPILVSIVLFVVVLCLARRLRKRHDAIVETTGASEISIVKESFKYNLSEIQAATNNFNIDNRIGEGGFGAVYKGTLPTGQKIAVKRIFRSSAGQGLEEFKNEIALVVKLQHRNLVALLGFCFEGEEKILIYQLIPNKSLDYFLFDSENQQLLDWSRRYKIIQGIARGVLYLHEESRLRIIHRDLKASNILLDENMDPKIADFGTAKLFGVDQSKGRASKIAGTLGYMPPEYIMQGQVSVKTDVFSFGVLILEIVSGKKSSMFYPSDGSNGLLSYAWKQWKKGTPLAILDPTIEDSCSRNEVLQSIRIGLLCVQKNSERRPTMDSVVLMLNSFSVTLPMPHPPAFFIHSRTENSQKELLRDGKSTQVPDSINETLISEVYPR